MAAFTLPTQRQDITPDDLKDTSGLPPNGRYIAEVVESDFRPTRTGQMITLTWQLLNNEKYNGYKVFQNINVVNPNPKTVEISMKQLAQIENATGNGRVNDTSMLEFKPCSIRVVLKKGSVNPATGEKYNDRLEVKHVAPLSDHVPNKSSGAGNSMPALNPQAASATGGKPPWANR